MCVCVCVCARSCSRECTCVRMCTCRMCGDVATCAMVHIKVKGTTSGIGPCLMPGLRWSACAWLLPPSPHRNTSIADTQWCAWIFVGPGESVLCMQGQQFITELSSQPGTALLCSHYEILYNRNRGITFISLMIKPTSSSITSSPACASATHSD